jgi:hypothetical protein
MKILRMDLESKLLLAGIGTCIWAAVQLIRPTFMPIWIGIVAVVAIGEVLALWCSDKGPHAVARLAVMSACFAIQSVAILNGTRYFFLCGICALFSVSYAGSALDKFRKTKRNTVSSIVPPKAGSDSLTAGEVTAQFKLPMIPVRDMVIVPGMTAPFVVGRESSVRALEYALANGRKLFLPTQHDGSDEEPKIKEISQFGCVCKVLENLKMPNGNVKVLVEGTEMAKATEVDESSGLFIATLSPVNIKVGVA